MPKTRLTAAFVRSPSSPPGIYGDEHGLRFRILPTGARQWIWRGTIHGRRRDLGLGSPPYVTLAEARETAFEYRRLARRGGDPAALRQHVAIPTFAEAIEPVLDVLRPSWKAGGRQEAIWRRAVEQYAIPRLGGRRLDQITAADCMAVLLPEWQSKHETMKRLRQYMGAVFKWGIAQGYRQDNPCGEAIGAALPKPSHAVQHQRALPHSEVAGALATVGRTEAHWSTKSCFAFLVHTACRSIEARGATWAEMDTEAALWTVPAERAKNGREHRIPLSAPALAILRDALDMADGGGLVFPSATGRTLSDNTLSKLLRENGVSAVPHGFRSSFRDWCGETSVAREVAEACLAHTVGNATERAYARSTMLDRRRKVMDAWSRYLTGERGKVIALR